MTSEKQTAANRRNAQRSTGPKTLRGKAAVSRNALKYGVLSEAVVVRGLEVKESAQEYGELCREFHEGLAPVGLLEEMLTGQIAALTWRLRRVRKAEAGEIALSVDEGHKKRSRINPDLMRKIWELAADQVGAMEQTLLGNQALMGWLEAVQAQVEKAGKLTEESVKFPGGGRTNWLSEKLENIRQVMARRYGGGADAENAEKEKSNTLELIGDMIRERQLIGEDCAKREQVEENVRQAAAVLPAEETLGKIMRYESALERQLFRAMNQLERLQERRRKNDGQGALPQKDENAKQSHFQNATIA